MKNLILVFLLFLTSILNAAEISVDEATSDGLYLNQSDMQYYILPESDLTINIRYDNSGGIIERAIINAFEVYSFDGSFSPIYGTANEAYQWFGISGFFDHFSIDCKN